uniref:PBPC1BS n=2 Tax=Rattus norvegicus TaxID=10116 RepID=Q7M743_RAT|nr:TPA_exp: PBPC1BS [Rattus norvegicus]
MSTVRLSPCLLIILTVCCYETNAGKICDAFWSESRAFLRSSEEDLKKELEKYSAPKKAVEAKLEVKQCVDQMHYLDRERVLLALMYVSLRCEKGWLAEDIFDIPGESI